MAPKRLRNIIIARREITVSEDEAFSVRGISLADLTRIFQRHTEVVTKLFNDFMAKKGNGKYTTEMLVEFIQQAAMDFPVLVAEIIAVANDDDSDEGVEVAMQLRSPVQVEALLTIMELSITTEAELKKLIEILTKAARQLMNLFSGVRAQVEAETGLRFPFGSSASGSVSIN